MPEPISSEFADLFVGVAPPVRDAIEQVLAVHHLDGMPLTRDVVADAIAYATDAISEAEYDQRARERAALHRG